MYCYSCIIRPYLTSYDGTHKSQLSSLNCCVHVFVYSSTPTEYCSTAVLGLVLLYYSLLYSSVYGSSRLARRATSQLYTSTHDLDSTATPTVLCTGMYLDSSVLWEPTMIHVHSMSPEPEKLQLYGYTSRTVSHKAKPEEPSLLCLRLTVMSVSQVIILDSGVVVCARIRLLEPIDEPIHASDAACTNAVALTASRRWRRRRLRLSDPHKRAAPWARRRRWWRRGCELFHSDPDH